MTLADGILKDYTKIVVETDETISEPIAIFTPDFIDVTNGYRVRMTPNYTTVDSDSAVVPCFTDGFKLIKRSSQR